MVVLRCTAKLLRHLPFPVEQSPDVSTTALGDWYANAFFVRNLRLVLWTSERSLLSVILPLREARTLPERLREAASDRLIRLGVSRTAAVAELDAMQLIQVARTANRRVLGSMNDFAHCCRWHIEDQGVADVCRLERMLDEMPCGAIGYQNPQAVTLRLLQG